MTRLEFEEFDGAIFYDMIKNRGLNLGPMDFGNTNLGRIDLHYDQIINQSDPFEDYGDFLKSNAEKISSQPHSPIVAIRPEVDTETLEI